MKRSRIDDIMAEADQMIHAFGFVLPPFAYWTPAAFKARGAGGSVMCDGIARRFAPGEKLRLAPGEIVTLMPGDWHVFWGEGGDVLIGEVSTMHDDEADNVFRDPIGRFAAIEEHTAPTHILVSDYRRWRV